MKTIILALENAIEREALKLLVTEKKKYAVIKETDNVQQLTKSPEMKLQADMVIMDLALQDTDDELSDLRIFRREYPFVKVLVLDDRKDAELIRLAYKYGIDGYLLKSANEDELKFSIRQIFSDKKILSNEVALNLLDSTRITTYESYNPFIPPTLTQRESEVLALIAEGFTNHEIAERLFTSRRTIEGHRFNLIKKLQVKNSAQLIKCALSAGLIRVRAS